MAQPPPPSEAGDGGEGRRGEAHHRVRDRHVAHKQVHPRVQARGPGCNTVTHVGDDMTNLNAHIQFRRVVGKVTRYLITVTKMNRFPRVPMLETIPYRTRKAVWTWGRKIRACSV